MPRDGSNIYHRPAGTDGVPDTPIESSKYNGYVADVEQDLNLPRPIVAGGTGASNAVEAMTALGGEIAKQLVTNYDLDPILPGSFFSNAGATSEPVSGHNFSGICHVNGTAVTLEARDLTDGKKYSRQKLGSPAAWGAWMQDAGTLTDIDGRYVNITGDTMTGQLAINMPGGGDNLFLVNTTANLRKSFRINVSGSLEIVNNAYTAVISTLSDVGNFSVPGTITAGGDIWANSSVIRFAGDTNKYLYHDGSNFHFNGGTVYASAFTAGTMWLNGSNLAITDGSNYILRGGNAVYFQSTAGATWGFINSSGLNVTSNVSASGNISCNGLVQASGGRIISYLTGDSPSVGCRNTGRGYNCGMWMGDKLYFGQLDDNGVPSVAWGDIFGTLFRILQNAQKPGGGTWDATSDERIKSVLGDYTSGLEEVAALQPVRYVYKGNDTDEVPSNSAMGITPDQKADARSAPSVPYPNSFHYGAATSQKEFIGLVAQQAEATMPELVTMREGYIDGQAVTDLRNIDVAPLIYALINSVKELKARVEELEAR